MPTKVKNAVTPKDTSRAVVGREQSEPPDEGRQQRPGWMAWWPQGGPAGRGLHMPPPRGFGVCHPLKPQ